MTAFIIIAVAMLAVALVCLLVPLLRSTSASAPALAQDASNVAILRSQLNELDADVANGTITRENYEQARRELEQRVLDDTRAVPASGATIAPFAGALTAAVLAGVLPVATIVLYLVLGSHEAFSPAKVQATADAQHDLSPQKVQEMAASLAAKLEKEPGNAEGWVILAHTYYSLKRFPDAVAAYERAAKLMPDNADLFADYADALGVTTNSLEGKPEALIARALEIDPRQWKALALAGTVAFNRKDYAKAVAYWERIKETVPPESEIARSMEASIAEARELGGIKVAAAAPGAPGAPFAFAPSTPATAAAAPAAPAAQVPMPAAQAAKPPAQVAAASGAATISGTVELARSLGANAAPTDTVFIFARAADGPKVPLAVLRKQVKDLPLSFTLDDSMAMAPEMKLSRFPDVVVGARVSRTGNAVPQSGDLEGVTKPVKTGTTGVAVIIDTARP